MKMQNILKILTSYGWVVYRDDAREQFALYTEEDLVVSVIPKLRKLSSSLSLTMRESMSTRDFSSAVSFIHGEKQTYYPLKTRFGSDWKQPVFNDNDLRNVASSIISWAQSVNINNELKIKRNLATSSPGIFPLHHLAALALNNDSHMLEHYLTSFRNGDRLGFVPYITEVHIFRALEFSKSCGDVSA